MVAVASLQCRSSPPSDRACAHEMLAIVAVGGGVRALMSPSLNRWVWVRRRMARDEARRWESQPVIMLSVHDVGIDGPLPEESGAATSVVSRRRVLAQRLLADLVGPPSPVPGHDLVSALSLTLPVAQLPG